MPNFTKSKSTVKAGKVSKKRAVLDGNKIANKIIKALRENLPTDQSDDHSLSSSNTIEGFTCDNQALPNKDVSNFRTKNNIILLYTKEDKGPFKAIVLLQRPNAEAKTSPSVEVSRTLINYGIRFSLIKKAG